MLLMGEGPTDRRLEPLLYWLLQHITECDFAIEFARRVSGNEYRRIQYAHDNHDFDVLVLHRDADSTGLAVRRADIATAATSFQSQIVALVPDREQETWLLVEEAAIRRAAFNRTAAPDLDLPRVSKLANVTDPKAMLEDRLRRASLRTGERLRAFDVGEAIDRLVGEISDWSALRQLVAFQLFEADLRRSLAAKQC